VKRQGGLRSKDPMDDATNAACGFSPHVLRSTTLILMVLLVSTILLTVLCSALLAISKRQEAMLELLLRQSGERQDTSVLSNPETRSQVGSYRSGSERSQAR
jgi:hypothetical protein